MSEAPTIMWSGQSGQQYKFWIFERGTTFTGDPPGIYIHAKQTTPHKWTPIYIGQTGGINVRLTNHEQESCVDRNGATHIHVRIVTDENLRLQQEEDLIRQWKPACNTHHAG